jgi:hypothetical protein
MQSTLIDPGKPWLSLTEAAAEAGLTTGVFLKHMLAGHLPYEGHKLGSGRAAPWRIRRVDEPNRSAS